MIEVSDIIKLSKEFNLYRNHYTNSITLSMPIIKHNTPDVFEFRYDVDKGTYDLHTFLSGIDKEQGLVYTMLFGTKGDCYEFCRLKFMEFELVYKKYKQELKLEEMKEDFKDDV